MRYKIQPKLVSKIRRTKSQAYTDNWQTISVRVISRDGKCTRCGAGSTPGNRLRAHHIIPISKGGRTTMYNLKTVCTKCHEKMPGHTHLRH